MTSTHSESVGSTEEKTVASTDPSESEAVKPAAGDGKRAAKDSGKDPGKDSGKDSAKDSRKDTGKPAGPSAARKALDAGAATVAQVRKLVGQGVWVFCVLAALSLAVGAGLIALGANVDNGAVAFVLDVAERADLGWFSRENGPFQATGENKVTKDALINWGLGAIVWLVAGKIGERIVRP